MQEALRFILLHFLHSNIPCPLPCEWDFGLRILILAQVITITLAFPTKGQSSRMVAAKTAFEQLWIMRIRNRDHMTEIENDWVSQNILRDRKRIKLSSRAISSPYVDIDTSGIKDIMRFNVAEMTRRMGKPRKELFVLKKNRYRRVKAERVYHLTMILCCGDGEHVRYKHLRIVLNRRKIKRIETLSAEYDY